MPKVLNAPINIGTAPTNYGDALRQAGFEPLIVSTSNQLDLIGEPTENLLVLIEANNISRLELKNCVDQCVSLNIPVFALVDKNRVADLGTVTGLTDFVVRPFSSEEIITRARRAIGRDVRGDAPNVIRVGDLAIDPASYKVTVAGRNVNLRYKEYELLLLMAMNPGRVYSRDQLLEHVWGYDYLGGTRTVDVHVRRLRSKIDDRDHQFVETVWNVGYRFREGASNLTQTHHESKESPK